VLGGTAFLGRHVVAEALEQGHEVTIFTRGHTNPWLFPEAEHLTGDRDGNLRPLVGRRWEGVIDTSGYVPRVVRQSAELLRCSVVRYVFVSSVSVYADHSRPYDEAAPLATLDDPASEDIWTNYGALKAVCESVLDEIYGSRTCHIRAGLIVGPHDPTNRFTYWPVRIAEGGEILAPDTPETLVQYIDARDIARWMIKLVASDVSGPMNATGPAEPTSLGETLNRIAAALSSDCRFHWVDGATLLEEGIKPWAELPLWQPDREYAGLLQADCSRALAAELELRPVEETARDTLDWARTAGEQRPTLTRDRERELLRKHTSIAV